MGLTYPPQCSDFNPRSPHGERRNRGNPNVTVVSISTHAPRTGSDFPSSARSCNDCISTHAPRTGSDSAEDIGTMIFDISTHAPRTGSDVFALSTAAEIPAYFNPRSPHGERHIRLPLCVSRRGISTHAPRTGSDQLAKMEKIQYTDFNPRSPHGERHMNGLDKQTRAGISTHAPRTGSDLEISALAPPDREISTHAPRTGSDVSTLPVVR